MEVFAPSLRKIFPDLQESDIERRFVFRERLVQPVPVLHYSDMVPEMETNVPGLWLANTTQIINSTLNNNEMVKIANRAVQKILGERGRKVDGACHGGVYAEAKQMATVSGLAGDRL